MAKAAVLNFDYARFSKQGDIMLAGGVVLILFVMLVPMPTLVIDLIIGVVIYLLYQLISRLTGRRVYFR